MAKRSIRGEPVHPALAVLHTKWLRGLSLYNALLDACLAVRYDKPKLMVELAEMAVHVASELSPRRHGRRKVVDYRCRALIELGNARRTADRLSDADTALGEAALLLSEGTGDPLLRVRMYDVQASLYADRRQFAAAAEALDMVHAIHLELGDSHLAGRALISKGIYRGYGGDPKEAIRLLREGLALVDHQRDLVLVLAGVQSQAAFLVSLGRFRDARKLLWSHHFPPEVVGAQVNRLKILWLEAQIHAGLGNDQQAEEGYLEVKAGFEKERLHYKAALVSLDLAHLWRGQGRMEEVRDLVAALVRCFQAYQIHREALVALMVLQETMERGMSSGALLDSVSEFLKKAETDPGLLAEDWFCS